MAAEEHTGACRANTHVTNCPLTSIRVPVPQKNLIIGVQWISEDHRRVFLWAVKTLHGANLFFSSGSTSSKSVM